MSKGRMFMSTQSPSTPKSSPISKAPKSAKPPKHPNNLRTAIQHSPWNFKQVAERTNIPRDTLSDYCAGKHPVPYERLQALAGLLNCLPEYLVPPFPNVRDAYGSRSQYEETKDLEALLLLRTHCQQHPTDENALQQLLELLGKVRRYAEIEKWYEQFVQAVKKEDIWRKPDAETSALLARLRAEATGSASPPAAAHVGPTSSTARPDPATDMKDSSALPKTDDALSAAPLTSEPPPSASSDQQDSHTSPGEPTPRPNLQTTVIKSDKAIVIYTPQVQILGQPFLDEMQGGTLRSVLVSDSYLLDPTAKKRGFSTRTDSQIGDTIPGEAGLEKEGIDTDPLIGANLRIFRVKPPQPKNSFCEKARLGN